MTALPPHVDFKLAIDTEAATVASLCRQPEKLHEARRRGLTPECFTDLSYRAIFEVLGRMVDEREPIDEITLGERLLSNPDRPEDKRHNDLKAACRMDLETLKSTDDRLGGSNSHVLAWVDRLVEKWKERRRGEIRHKITSAGAFSGDFGDEFGRRIEEFQAELAAVEAVGGRDTSQTKAAEDARALVDRLASGEKPEAAIRTPLPNFDGIFGPIARHELVVLAARPSDGKTSFMTQCALASMRAGKRILIASLEMQRQEILLRLADQSAEMDHKELRRCVERQKAEYVRRLDAISARLGESLHITSESSIDGLDAIVRQHISEDTIDAVFVDYCQLLEDAPGSKASRVEQLSRITRKIKLWTGGDDKGRRGVPVLLLSQFSRGVEKERRKPIPSDLRDSGSLEQDADRILALHSAKRAAGEEEVGQTERSIAIIQLKCREGPRDVLIDMKFNGPQKRFQEDFLG